MRLNLNTTILNWVIYLIMATKFSKLLKTSEKVLRPCFSNSCFKNEMENMKCFNNDFAGKKREVYAISWALKRAKKSKENHFNCCNITFKWESGILTFRVSMCNIRFFQQVFAIDSKSLYDKDIWILTCVQFNNRCKNKNDQLAGCLTEKGESCKKFYDAMSRKVKLIN